MVFFITLVVVSKLEMTDCLYMICVSSVSTWRLRVLWLLRLLMALWVNSARRVTCKTCFTIRESNSWKLFIFVAAFSIPVDILLHILELESLQSAIIYAWLRCLVH